MHRLISRTFQRCRFRFGLRLIFLATALCAAGLAYRMHQVRREAVAIRHIAQLGGRVVYGTQGYAGAWLPDSLEPLSKPTAVAVDLSRTHLRAEDLKQIGVLSGLTRLNLQNTQIEAGVLGPLTKLERLESLLLAEARITDRDLACLAELENLKTLSLSDTPIGDEGLAYAAGLTRIENLDLLGTEVTAAGLGRLKSLPNLISLGIEDSCITRSIVRSLRGSAKLQNINVHVRAGLGKEAHGLLQGFERTSIRAFSHPNGTVLWDPSRPWQETTGGVLMRLESQLNLDEAEIVVFRDVLARRRPNGEWTVPFATQSGLMLAQQNAEIAPVCHRELRQWLASDAAHGRASAGSLVHMARAELDQNGDMTIARLVVRSLLELSRDPDADIQLKAASALERIAIPGGDGGG